MLNLSEIIEATGAKAINLIKSESSVGDISTDSRNIKDGDVFLALRGERFDGHDFIDAALNKGAKTIIVSRPLKENYPVNILKVKDTTIALGEIAKYFRNKQKQVPLIALTGSAGKTTTKDIIFSVLNKDYHVLKNNLTENNHIGVPQTILKMNKKHDACVLELGTNHFGEIAYLSEICQPEIAVITNIGPSHLESFKNLGGVLKEKKNILRFLENPKIALLNGDDSYLRRIKENKKARFFYFGTKGRVDFGASGITIGKNGVKFTFNRKHVFHLPTLGKFYVHNALAGIACGLFFGLSITKIKDALENFEFAPHRFNKIEHGNITIIDDTYNSNPLSLEQAIDTLAAIKAKGRKILVMADMLELGKDSIKMHAQIGSKVVRCPIDIFVTLGKLSSYAARVARAGKKKQQEVFDFSSQDSIINFLKQKIKPGDVILVKGSRAMRMERIVDALM